MTEDGARALFVRVEGQVQGVGYRAFTQDEAAKLGVKGWVVNRTDGSVEAALYGDGSKLAELIGRLRKGPTGARVEALDASSTDRGRIGEVPDGGYQF